jgi:TolB-like protein
MRLALSLVAALAAAVPLAAQERATFAVLPFRNEQSFGLEPEAYHALELGIAQLVASEIGRSPAGQLADRRGTAQAAGPRTQATRHDAAAAQRIGGLVGARYVVTGNFVDAFGKLRLNARVVDVQTGRFLQAVTNAEPALHDRARLHESIKAVSRQLLEEIGLPAPAASPAVPFDAVLAFSRGLAAEERDDRGAAAASYRAALGAGEFPEAREALQRVQ